MTVDGRAFQNLPEGAVVGTSSLRRQVQLMAMRPDIEIKMLRGNVNTRLAKLDNGDFDAIILAAAGLERLGLEHYIIEVSGNMDKLNALINLLKPMGIKKIARTGAVALFREPN